MWRKNHTCGQQALHRVQPCTRRDCSSPPSLKRFPQGTHFRKGPLSWKGRREGKAWLNELVQEKADRVMGRRRQEERDGLIENFLRKCGNKVALTQLCIFISA